ncbi:MAG: HAMP domain-containing histidine kinase [Candidatus Scalindua sp.]|nr:HAMP domain-containing histidine kinase [Candidatus Scalindua sp.]
MKEQVLIKIGIRWKLLSAMIGLIVGLLTINTIVQTMAQKNILQSELDKRIALMKDNIRVRGMTFSDHLARLTENGIASFNFSNVRRVLKKSVDDDKDLMYAILMDYSARAYIHTLKPELEDEILSDSEDLFAKSQTKATVYEYQKRDDSFMEFIVPIKVSVNPWGVLRLGFSLHRLHEEIEHSRNDISKQARNVIVRSTLTSFVFIIFGISVVFVISNRFSRPLIELTESARKLAKGEFTVADNIKVTSGDEIGILASAFNEMSRNLKISHDKLEEYSLSLEQIVADRTLRLRELNDALQEQDKLKTEFVSTVSHELRTPLALMLGFAKIINKKLNSIIFPNVKSWDDNVRKTMKQVEENVDIIVLEGKRLTDLINDLLDIAKIEAGEVEWKMETISLLDIMEHVTIVTDNFIDNKRLELVMDVAEGLPKIVGDKDRLIQVVINLISNAVKFTQKGTITCSVKKLGNEVLIGIKDTGIGIPVIDQQKIFDKFKQVGDMQKGKPKGTGLGLPICKKIVEHHGGRIWVDSETGRGSTFSFTLPFSTNSTDSVLRRQT